MRNALLLCFACAACMQLSAYGQKLFDIGIKGGVNLDDLSTDHAHTGVLGGEAGVFARVKPPLLPGAQAEALLSSSGASVTVDGQRAEVRALSLMLPVFILFSIGPLDLQAGAYYDVPLSRTWNISGTLTEEGNAVALDRSRPGTYGLLAGAAVHLGHLYLGARYNYGMQDLATGPYLSDIRERQTQFYLGWGFL
jgi:hypothetical protein